MSVQAWAEPEDEAEEEVERISKAHVDRRRPAMTLVGEPPEPRRETWDPSQVTMKYIMEIPSA